MDPMGQPHPGQPLPYSVPVHPYAMAAPVPIAVAPPPQIAPQSTEDRLREEVAQLKAENAELRGDEDEVPLGPEGGPPKKRGRQIKDEGQRPKKGGRPPKWALSEGGKAPGSPEQPQEPPKGKGTHSRRPKKTEGTKKPRGAPTSEYHGVSAAPSKKNPWQARATNPVSLGGDGKYKSIGLFNTEREAAMAVDDYLYKTFPEKYAAFRANFPRNADGSRPDPDVGGPPPPPSI